MSEQSKRPNYRASQIFILALIATIASVAVLSSPFGKEMYDHADDFVVAVFTVLLVVVGIMQLGLFWWQLRLLSGSLIDTRLAAEAAKESADANKKAVELAENTAKMQLRCYLALTTESPLPNTKGGFHVKTLQNANITVDLIFYVLNNGLTPAYDVRSTVFIDIGVPSGHDRLLASRQIDPAAPSNGVVNPGEVISVHREFQERFNGTEAKEVYAGKRQFYIYGKIEFKDAFKETRSINFQYFIKPGRVANDIYRQWEISASGNYTSEN